MTRSRLPQDDLALLSRTRQVAESIERELATQIVGQKQVIRPMLCTLLAGGHSLLVGVPGLAKTLMIQSLAQVLDLPFRRIQFTPDLMPADITGTEVLVEDRQAGVRELRFVPGPIFAQMILADEINRTPPKTQAALLEAMQERQVTAGGKRHPLPQPFFVLATQNPVEQEGTYPLPEAQLDRFMTQLWVDYPTVEEELDIVLRTTDDRKVNLQPQVSQEEWEAMMHLTRRIAIDPSVAKVALQLARRTRPGDPEAPEEVKRYVTWGAGPRASQHLVLLAKAWAALEGEPLVLESHIHRVALPVLRHRVQLNFQADAEGLRVDSLLQAIIDQAADRSASRGSLGDFFRS
ncbi:MAG: AAA family ATPase [Pirellulaceae bacterium]|jgi:MoxR-like ATPase